MKALQYSSLLPQREWVACKEQATDAKYDSKEGAAAESIESAESDKKVAESYDPDS
ncbi:hypothetical protein [uncultured Acetatifactor sp.]|jgi:hypothetical protein|uniref:hypothetical protein n=1 Tax=uncultured Acetatifactor sp. TaxID=1671927 RepID=UPI002631B1AD|nr:hypothetical protein [uncultured Acetatifactor sp.]